MQQAIKIAVAVIAIALIVGMGWTLTHRSEAPVSQATAQPEAAATSTPDSTSTPEPAETAAPQTTEEAVQEETGDLYEGALAGLTQEQIAEMALAEEAASKELGNSGAEGAVD